MIRYGCLISDYMDVYHFIKYFNFQVLDSEEADNEQGGHVRFRRELQARNLYKGRAFMETVSTSGSLPHKLQAGRNVKYFSLNVLSLKFTCKKMIFWKILINIEVTLFLCSILMVLLPVYRGLVICQEFKHRTRGLIFFKIQYYWKSFKKWTLANMINRSHFQNATSENSPRKDRRVTTFNRFVKIVELHQVQEIFSNTTKIHNLNSSKFNKPSCLRLGSLIGVGSAI